MTTTFDASTLGKLLAATNEKAVREFLATLPIVPDDDYVWSEDAPGTGWTEGKLHWLPVGLDLGNMGHIKLAGSPENPLAERVVNGMEALIELERRRELITSPQALAPQSPREAALRYFKLPPLDVLPTAEGKPHRKVARDVARRLRLRLLRSQKPVEYAVIVEDDGIGQQPSKLHSTILSLGSSDKADKRYMIGVFGHGGSSAFEASKVSWIVSRRAPGIDQGQDDGVGWTLVRQVFRKGRRDSYWAYLAATSDGHVPRCDPGAADGVGFKHGTRIAHVNYNFGPSEPSVSLYRSLNHLLFKPVLPYELFTKKPGDAPDPMWGNAYRLSRLKKDVDKELDKTFAPQKVQGKPGAAEE